MEIIEGEDHQHLLHYTYSSELEAAEFVPVGDTAGEPAAAPAAARPRKRKEPQESGQLRLPPDIRLYIEAHHEITGARAGLYVRKTI